MLDAAVSSFLYVNIGESAAERCRFFYLVHVEVDIVATDDLYHLSGEETLLVGCMVVDDDGGL